MQGWVETLFRYPTVIFTALMLVVSAFWLLSLVGGLDFDLFGAPDVDVDADATGGGGSVAEALGLSGIPVTIAATLVVVFGWLTSMFLSETIGEYVDEHLPAGWSRTALGVGALVVALGLAALCARPIRKALGSHKAQRKHELIGRPVRITSMRVTGDQGQGEIDDGQAGVVAQVRCPHANGLTLHSPAVVVAFDVDVDAFQVEPDDAA
jgi:hypothetical protein